MCSFNRASWRNRPANFKCNVVFSVLRITSDGDTYSSAVRVSRLVDSPLRLR